MLVLLAISSEEGLTYLGAVCCLGLQVIEGDQFSKEAAFLVASLHTTEFKVGLTSLQDEPQIDGKSSHVYRKWPVGVEHCLPANHLPCPIHPWGLIPKATNEGHRPHGHPPCAAHLQGENLSQDRGLGCKCYPFP